MIILLCAAKQSGKDVCANYISKKYSYNHLKITESLKKCLKILFNFNDNQIEGNLKEIVDTKYNTTPRNCMKFLGTHVFQYEIQKLLPDMNRNFWIDKLYNHKIKGFENNNIIISDLRFKHEIEYIKKNCKSDIFVIEILRTNIYVDTSDDTENEILTIHKDFTIVNDSSLNMFYKHIDTVMGEISSSLSTKQ
jgi:hypothetical protein